MTAPSVVIAGAVEGDADKAVLRCLISVAGDVPGTIYGKAGKERLKQQIEKFNRAAAYSPWCVCLTLTRMPPVPPDYGPCYCPSLAQVCACVSLCGQLKRG